MNDEIHKQAFVGKKFENLYNKKFSLLSFFFGELYWAYRKMIVEAILLLVIKTLIGLLLSKLVSLLVSKFVVSMGDAIVSVLGIVIGLILISLITGIISGFLFGPLYRKFVDRRVEKIKDKDICDSEADEITMCEKKGGTSILFLIIFFIISTTISGKIYSYDDTDYSSDTGNNSSITIVSDDETNVSDDEAEVLDNDEKDKIKTNSDENDSTLNSEDESNTKIEERKYDEYTYNILTNIDISKFVDIEISDLFNQDNEDDYIKEYSHEDGTKKDISFSISSIEAESAEDFIKDVTETNGLSLENDMYSIELNDLKWYIIGFELNGKIIYYNAFDYENNVFLYRYEIDSNVQDEELLKSYEDVIYSIKMNDEESDVNSRD